MRFKRNLSISLIVSGILILLFSVPSITGFSVFNSEINRTINLFGLFLLVMGLILFGHSDSSSATLEARVDVYVNRAHKKSHESSGVYFMTDPKLNFGNNGVVSLDDFRIEIERYKEMGKEGEELIEIIRSEYESPLQKIALSDDVNKSAIAKTFLRVLNPSLDSSDESSTENNSYVRLNPDERREIHLAFRPWDGNLSRIPKEVRQKYGIVEEKGSKHVSLYQEDYPENKVSASSTPSVPMGDRLATLIIRMIEKNRNRKKTNA